MIQPVWDEGLWQEIKHKLDLRAPNADGVKTVAIRVAEHFAVSDEPFEGTIDAATAVGKTYMLAGLVDYFTACGFRNFAVIAPGTTVSRKTINNFTPGHPKSLLSGMETQPLLIAADNFDSPEVADAIADPTLAKLYVFTVQALLTPTSKADRRTHEFRENLGAGFYERLRELDDLVLIADESHTYGGKKFAAAVAGLHPRIHLGLTATPPRGANVIFHYPLAAAIAEGWVKTPVINGRRDDLDDAHTKLADGVRLLEVKRRAVEAYLAERPEAPRVNPVMLVIAADTTAAAEAVGILEHPNFEGGRYAEAILEIHSNVDDPDEALAKLEDVENPDSEVRVIVSVGMLKEGWDVKNVYVICALRALVSDILAEQTLGRGLRLPFGRLTRVPVLDTLEVVAHERYDALISRIDKVRDKFIDYRTVTEGAETQEQQVVTPVEVSTTGEVEIGKATVVGIDQRVEHEHGEVEAMEGEPLPVRSDLPPLELPIVQAAVVEAPFSLSEIISVEPFRTEGRRLATEPEENLRRTEIGAKVETDAETGERVARFQRRKASDTIEASTVDVPLDEALRRLRADLVASGAVPNRPAELKILDRLIDAFVDGMGAVAGRALAVYQRRAADAIAGLIREAQTNRQPTISLGEVEMRRFDTERRGQKKVLDRYNPFVRGVGYTGFTKSLYTQDWFHAGTTEFAFANLIDDSPDVVIWLRLQLKDLALPWRASTRDYNPDFVVVDTDDIRWLVETKADDDATDEDVTAKGRAATQWATHVTAQSGQEWRYLFVTEGQIAKAKGAWSALRQLALAK